MELAQLFGSNVRRARQDRGLTLEVLADEAGLTYSYVGQIERGQRNPSLRAVEQIARVLKVEAHILLMPRR